MTAARNEINGISTAQKLSLVDRELPRQVDAEATDPKTIATWLFRRGGSVGDVAGITDLPINAAAEIAEKMRIRGPRNLRPSPLMHHRRSEGDASSAHSQPGVPEPSVMFAKALIRDGLIEEDRTHWVELQRIYGEAGRDRPTFATQVALEAYMKGRKESGRGNRRSAVAYSEVSKRFQNQGEEVPGVIAGEKFIDDWYSPKDTNVSKSLAALSEAHGDKLFRFVMFRTGDKVFAEDVVSDTYVRLLEKLGGYPDVLDNPGGTDGVRFATIVTRNILYDRVKSSDHQRVDRRTGDGKDDARQRIMWADDPISPEDQVINDDQLKSMWEAVARLNPAQREVIRLRIKEELSVRDAATTLGINEGAVKASQHRALLRLQKLMAKHVTPDQQSSSAVADLQTSESSGGSTLADVGDESTASAVAVADIHQPVQFPVRTRRVAPAADPLKSRRASRKPIISEAAPPAADTKQSDGETGINREALEGLSPYQKDLFVAHETGGDINEVARRWGKNEDGAAMALRAGWRRYNTTLISSIAKSG